MKKLVILLISLFIIVPVSSCSLHKENKQFDSFELYPDAAKSASSIIKSINRQSVKLCETEFVKEEDYNNLKKTIRLYNDFRKDKFANYGELPIELQVPLNNKQELCTLANNTKGFV